MSITEGALWCVVPAAGRGTRFGSEVPKQYSMLAGEPLLVHTLRRLAAHPRIGGLMVVLAAGDPHWPDLVELAGKPVATCAGGSLRAQSVLAGLAALRGRIAADAFVLVHDAARPCVRAGDISRLLDQALPAGGGLLATPLRDTLKRADVDRRAIATEPRDMRWCAQTPQVFRCDALAAALESALAASVEVTDEAMAMEFAGHRPLLVEGAQSNIKVTTPEDLELATFLLRRET
jgi:2-C-methyl-D-erythritol 4-phosphate cytidylyltransferase